MVNKNIILLLDESGSMNCQRGDVVDGVNKMIKQQQKLNKEPVNLTIIKFSNSVTQMRSSLLNKAQQFYHSDYSPNGGTALYDAIGLTIDKYKHTVGTIFLILTDGQENSSRTYSKWQIKSMMDKQRMTKNWNIIYLSEDPMTEKQGEWIGITNETLGCSNTCVGKRRLGDVLGSSRLQMYVNAVQEGKTKDNFNNWKYF